MKFEDIKVGKVYKKYTTGLVLRVKDIKQGKRITKIVWQPLNMKCYEYCVFKDNIKKIDFYDWMEEKDFEKYIEI